MNLLHIIICLLILQSSHAQSQASLNGFTQWRTGHDEATRQLIPAKGNDALMSKKGKVIARAKFSVKGYGEMSFPLDARTGEGAEARKVDLSQSSFVRITYKATHSFILQLRQTGVHGGVHNKIMLPASKKFVTRTIYFTAFQEGKTPLDLSDVAKFNFAFLGRKDETPYTAELVVKSVEIDNYHPRSARPITDP
jgi:hypothetical protein